MTEQFKAGDRVEYRNDQPEDPANGEFGTVSGASEFSEASAPRVRVEWTTTRPMPLHPFTRNLRPVEPQK